MPSSDPWVVVEVEVWVPLAWVTVVVVVPVVELVVGCWLLLLPEMAPMMEERIPLAKPASPDPVCVEVEVEVLELSPEPSTLPETEEAEDPPWAEPSAEPWADAVWDPAELEVEDESPCCAP